MLKRKSISVVFVFFLLANLFFSFSLANPAQAAEVKVMVDGKTLSMDVKPVIEKGRTLVPLRTIFEALDVEVGWDEKTRTVTAVKGSTQIKLVIGNTTALKSGKSVKLDVPAKILNGRTLVPVRFVSEALGAKVDWNGSAHTVTITRSGGSSVGFKLSKEIKLEDVDPGPITKTTMLARGEVKFSPNSKYAVVGSEKGYIRVIDMASDEVIFTKDMGIGSITALAFSVDGKRLYVGEQSPDGYLYCFEIPSGKELWKFRTADELGNELKTESYPAVKRILEDNKGRLYFVAYRSYKHSSTNYDYWTRVYSLNGSTGKVNWKFPEKELMDVGSYWIDITPDGKSVAFSTGTFGNKTYKYPSGAIYFLNGDNGEKKWSYTFKALPQMAARFWYSPSLSPNGKYLSALMSDGRGFLFNDKGKVLWTKAISTPRKVSGVWIYGSANDTYIHNNQVIFSIGNTYTCVSGQVAPAEHPNSCCVFAYDLKGNILWKWKSDGYPRRPGISADGRYVAIPVMNNVNTHDLEAHGVCVIDNNIEGGIDKKVFYVYKSKTKGPMVSADISPNGKYIVALETVVRLSDGASVAGEYKVHILKR